MRDGSRARPRLSAVCAHSPAPGARSSSSPSPTRGRGAPPIPVLRGSLRAGSRRWRGLGRAVRTIRETRSGGRSSRRGSPDPLLRPDRYLRLARTRPARPHLAPGPSGLPRAQPRRDRRARPGCRRAALGVRLQPGHSSSVRPRGGGGGSTSSWARRRPPPPHGARRSRGALDKGGGASCRPRSKAAGGSPRSSRGSGLPGAPGSSAGGPAARAALPPGGRAAQISAAPPGLGEAGAGCEHLGAGGRERRPRLAGRAARRQHRAPKAPQRFPRPFTEPSPPRPPPRPRPATGARHGRSPRGRSLRGRTGVGGDCPGPAPGPAPAEAPPPPRSRARGGAAAAPQRPRAAAHWPRLA